MERIACPSSLCSRKVVGAGEEGRRFCIFFSSRRFSPNSWTGIRRSLPAGPWSTPCAPTRRFGIKRARLDSTTLPGEQQIYKSARHAFALLGSTLRYSHYSFPRRCDAFRSMYPVPCLSSNRLVRPTKRSAVLSSLVSGCDGMKSRFRWSRGEGTTIFDNSFDVESPFPLSIISQSPCALTNCSEDSLTVRLTGLQRK